MRNYRNCFHTNGNCNTQKVYWQNKKKNLTISINCNIQVQQNNGDLTIRFIVTVAIVVYKSLVPVVYRMNL